MSLTVTDHVRIEDEVLGNVEVRCEDFADRSRAFSERERIKAISTIH